MTHSTIGSISAIVLAEATPLINRVAQLHIPPIVMEIFQLIAWASAAVIAFVGVMRYIKNVQTQEHEE